jgi:outer membrane protein assembly factor BamB
LVSDGKVIVDTGSKDGALVAMNAKTGDLVWRGGSDEAGYASPMLRANKPSEVLLFNRFGLCSFLLADGKPLYRFQHKTRYGINVAQPLDTGNSILISSAYGKGSALVDVSGRTAKAVWETESFSSQMASMIKKDNYAYGIHGQTGARAKYATLCCLDIRKGSTRWEQKGFGLGSVILVGDTLVILSDSGELALAEANPAGYMEKARFQVLGGKDSWTPPSYSNGRLYCRSSRGDVVCLGMAVTNK